MKGLSCLFLVTVFTGFLTADAFSQPMVSGFADISVCDVPGTNQVVVTGTHLVSETDAPEGHTHTTVVVNGVISRYTIADRCEEDFGGSSIATCANSTSDINGSVACSTTGGGPCSNSYRAKTIPKHNPIGGAINNGTFFSYCAAGDCIGDPGCSPFQGICY